MLNLYESHAVAYPVFSLVFKKRTYTRMTRSGPSWPRIWTRC